MQFLTYTDSKSCGGGFEGECDFYFKTIEFHDTDGNILNTIARTEDTANSETVDFSTLNGLRDPIDLMIPTHNDIMFSISVYDEDINRDDFLRTMSDLTVPFSDVMKGSGWIEETYTASNNRGRIQASLTIQYRLINCNNHFTGLGCNYCETNYYGNDCSKFCSENANYTCNDSGDKDCRDHLYPPQKCDSYCEPVPGNYTCDQTTGEKICDGKKAGKDCEDCAVNHYPRGECNVFCSPEVGIYDCKLSGEKNCQGNWAGSHCESCKTNYYKIDCSKFCNETSANYTCDGSGDKVCRDHFYPPQKCDTYCEPIEGNYACDNTTGEKICYGNKTGDDCGECVEHHYPEGECNVLCEPEVGNYTCTDKGVKRCRGNRTGSNCEQCLTHHFAENCSKFCNDTSANFTCDTSGDKECRDHFYPEQNCNTYCKPEPSYYTCNKSTGDKICESGDACDECRNKKIGQNCDQCKINFDGNDCTACATHYYPDGKCDVHCEPVPGNYQCNKTTGARICQEGKTGDDCDQCKSINCSTIHQDEKTDDSKSKQKMNIAIIAGGTAGAGLIFLFFCIIGLFLVKQRKQSKGNALENVEDVMDEYVDAGGEYETHLGNEICFNGEEAVYSTPNNLNVNATESTDDAEYADNTVILLRPLHAACSNHDEEEQSVEKEVQIQVHEDAQTYDLYSSINGQASNSKSVQSNYAKQGKEEVYSHLSHLEDQSKNDKRSSFGLFDTNRDFKLKTSEKGKEYTDTLLLNTNSIIQLTEEPFEDDHLVYSTINKKLLPVNQEMTVEDTGVYNTISKYPTLLAPGKAPSRGIHSHLATGEKNEDTSTNINLSASHLINEICFNGAEVAYSTLNNLNATENTGESQYADVAVIFIEPIHEACSQHDELEQSAVSNRLQTGNHEETAVHNLSATINEESSTDSQSNFAEKEKEEVYSHLIHLQNHPEDEWKKTYGTSGNNRDFKLKTSEKGKEYTDTLLLNTNLITQLTEEPSEDDHLVYSTINKNKELLPVNQEMTVEDTGVYNTISKYPTQFAENMSSIYARLDRPGG